jgi:hypothetical protein
MTAPTAPTTPLSIEEAEALTNVYAVAARLRQFPVPFDDHMALVDAVDQCRSIIEPPIDPFNESPTAPAQPTGWQAHVDAYSREEFLAMFRQAHATLHRLWTDAVGKEGYDKNLWRTLDNALARFARDAGEKVGLDRSEPLL